MRYPDILRISSALLVLSSGALLTASVDTKEILFLAGKKSHGYGAHEHKAGSMLLARCLNESGLNINAQVVIDGKWPQREENEARPDSIVMYCDGFKRHLAKDHQSEIQAWVDHGVGVAHPDFGARPIYALYVGHIWPVYGHI